MDQIDFWRRTDLGLLLPPVAPEPLIFDPAPFEGETEPCPCGGIR